MPHPSEARLERAVAQAGGCTCTWAEDNTTIERLDDNCPIRGSLVNGYKHPDEKDGTVKWTPITREYFFMEVARLVAKRSTCKRGHVGAIIVRDRRIVSTGYNGAPPGLPHCLEADCLIGDSPNEGCQRAIHAEANAIAWAARAGISTEGAAMWSSYSPCTKCAHLIISAGIVEVNYNMNYRLENLKVLEDAGVRVIAHSD